MPRQFQFRNEDGHETVEIAVRGRQVLARPMLNRGSAFTLEQRDALGLRGLIPPAVNSIDDQVRRCYGQFQMQSTNLAKYVYLNTLQDLNEILFHRLVADHLEEMMPIIYTPTVGEAIQQFSSTFDRQRGIYLSIEDGADAESIATALAAYGNGPDDVDIVVVTDSEGILGIGDQGVGGIRIAAMSGINRAFTDTVTIKRGKRSKVKVEQLPDVAPQQQHDLTVGRSLVEMVHAQRRSVTGVDRKIIRRERVVG